MYEELVARIMANTVHDPETGCRIWQGNTDGRDDPYGRVSFKGTTIAPHIAVGRYGLQKQGKKPRKGYQFDHKCNRRLCVEENHLQEVTNLRNQRLKKKRAKHKGNPLKCLEVK